MTVFPHMLVFLYQKLVLGLFCFHHDAWVIKHTMLMFMGRTLQNRSLFQQNNSNSCWNGLGLCPQSPSFLWCRG